jgi:hypothetical protein
MRPRPLLLLAVLALSGCGGAGGPSSIAIEAPEQAAIWKWQVVKAGAPDQVVAETESARSLEVPPGTYQLAVLPDEHQAGRAVWPEPIRVKRGQRVAVKLGGIALDVPANAPLWRWQIVKAGAPEEVAQWTTSAQRTLLVPPGEYQLTTQETEHDHGRVVWPETIRVGHDVAAAALRSGVALELPHGVSLWKWELVRPDAPDEPVAWTRARDLTLLAPPGEYLVAIQEDEHDTGRVIWPQQVRVSTDAFWTVPLRTGVILQVPEEAPLWRWEVVKAGAPEVVVQWTRRQGQRLLLVPPGDYQVALRQDEHDTGKLAWPQRVALADGQMGVVSADSGIRLAMPENARVDRWQVVNAGAPEEVVQWARREERTLIVPPGDYRVVVQPDEHKPEKQVWPDTGVLKVSAGRIVQAGPEAVEEPAAAEEAASLETLLRSHPTVTARPQGGASPAAPAPSSTPAP